MAGVCASGDDPDVMTYQHSQLEAEDTAAPVFIPSLRVTAGTDRFWPELRRLVDGRLALPVYTSVGDLVDACGPHQPWVAVPVEALERLREQTVVDTIAVNVPIPPEARHGVDPEYATFPGKPEEWND